MLKSPGTPVECGVCGAMRFHSSTKQASKFGIICCDACRKFIAKMILRARSSDNSVPCEKGQGRFSLLFYIFSQVTRLNSNKIFIQVTVQFHHPLRQVKVLPVKSTVAGLVGFYCVFNV